MAISIPSLVLVSGASQPRQSPSSSALILLSSSGLIETSPNSWTALVSLSSSGISLLSPDNSDLSHVESFEAGSPTLERLLFRRNSSSPSMSIASTAMPIPTPMPAAAALLSPDPGDGEGVAVAPAIGLEVVLFGNNDKSLDAYATMIGNCLAWLKFIKVDVVVDPDVSVPMSTIGLGGRVVLEPPAPLVLPVRYW